MQIVVGLKLLVFGKVELNRILMLEILADEVEEDRAGMKTWDPTFFTPHEGAAESMLLMISRIVFPMFRIYCLWFSGILPGEN